ncbi:hypothetical protein [Xenorhabdus sp. TH1]|uniref:hypothetical protein n=1 Tax=Xenorhabdus sp. TH1 TaxID=3130166 RepID=UPI0030D3BFD6
MDKNIKQVEVSDGVMMIPYSYVLCRHLTDNSVVDGVSVIGTYKRELVTAPETNLPFTTAFIEYAWIEKGNGKIVDPCENLRLNKTGVNLTEKEKSLNYFDEINPTNVNNKQLPKHCTANEIFTLKKGAESEAVRRILDYETNIFGLTMTEAAYIANLNLAGYLGYERIIMKLLINRHLKSIINKENFKNLFSATRS